MFFQQVEDHLEWYVRQFLPESKSQIFSHNFQSNFHTFVVTAIFSNQYSSKSSRRRLFAAKFRLIDFRSKTINNVFSSTSKSKVKN